MGAGSWVLHHLLKGRGQSRGVGTNTQRVSSGEGRCVGSQGHPGFQVALASPCGSGQMVSPRPSHWHGPSQQAHLKAPPQEAPHHASRITPVIYCSSSHVFAKMQFFIDSLYLLSGPQLPGVQAGVFQHFRGVATTGSRSVGYTCLLPPSIHPPAEPSRWWNGAQLSLPPALPPLLPPEGPAQKPSWLGSESRMRTLLQDLLRGSLATPRDWRPQPIHGTLAECSPPSLGPRHLCLVGLLLYKKYSKFYFTTTLV